MISFLFEKIKNTGSTIEKVKLLKFHNNLGSDTNADLKKILVYAYSKDIIFGITSKQINLKSTGLQERFPYELYEQLMKTEGRNAKIKLLETHLPMFRKLTQEYFLRGLDKDLGIGVSIKTINKAFPGLINEVEIMLAHKADPEDFQRLFKDAPWVFVNLKIDGIRATCHIKNNEVRFVSRDGHELPEFLLELIKMEVKSLYLDKDIILDGEIYADDFQKLMKVVNRKKIDFDNTVIRNQCKYAVFDVIDTTKQLVDRVKFLETIPEGIYVKKVKYAVLQNDYNLLLKLARKKIEQGHEGIMVKHPYSMYEFKRSKMWMKFKNKNTEDLRVVGYVEGEKGTKYEGQLGALIVDFYGVQVNVGSGFTDVQRVQFWKDRENLIDKLIEISYMEVTKDKSLRHPVFERLREDRSK